MLGINGITPAPIATITVPEPVPVEKTVEKPLVTHVTSGAERLSEATVVSLIAQNTFLSNQNQYEMLETLRCESRFRTKVRGLHGEIGIAQIHNHEDGHTEITDAQAEDPVWSINWMAGEFAAGRKSQWTCWVKLFGI